MQKILSVFAFVCFSILVACGSDEEHEEDAPLRYYARCNCDDVCPRTSGDYTPCIDTKDEDLVLVGISYMIDVCPHDGNKAFYDYKKDCLDNVDVCTGCYCYLIERRCVAGDSISLPGEGSIYKKPVVLEPFE